MTDNQKILLLFGGIGAFALVGYYRKKNMTSAVQPSVAPTPAPIMFQQPQATILPSKLKGNILDPTIVAAYNSGIIPYPPIGDGINWWDGTKWTGTNAGTPLNTIKPIQYKFTQDTKVTGVSDCSNSGGRPCDPVVMDKVYKAGDIITAIYSVPLHQTNPMVGAPDFIGSITWTDAGMNYSLMGDLASNNLENAEGIACMTAIEFTGGKYYCINGGWNW